MPLTDLGEPLATTKVFSATGILNQENSNTNGYELFVQEIGPELSIGQGAAGGVAVSFSSDYEGYVLQASDDGLESWQDVDVTPRMVVVVEDDGAASNRTYRLIKKDGEARLFIDRVLVALAVLLLLAALGCRRGWRPSAQPARGSWGPANGEVALEAYARTTVASAGRGDVRLGGQGSGAALPQDCDGGTCRNPHAKTSTCGRTLPIPAALHERRAGELLDERLEQDDRNRLVASDFPACMTAAARRTIRRTAPGLGGLERGPRADATRR
jgi:hypothetical protein